MLIFKRIFKIKLSFFGRAIAPSEKIGSEQVYPIISNILDQTLILDPYLFKPLYISFPWSKLESLSDHHIENFLNFSKLTQLLSLGEFLRLSERPFYLW